MNKTGFIGLGIMGLPMSGHLLENGVELIVNDIDANAVAKAVAKGAVQGSYKEIGEQCDVIFLMVPTGAISRQILFGDDGVAKHLSAGKVVCDMSSVTPVDSRYCAEELKKLGVGFVDAPVSGGEPGAVRGSLSIMCGGAEADFERLRPYFDMMGSSAVLLGEPGAGSVTKLANQIIVNLNIAALSEALVLATKCGVDPEKVHQAIKGGLAGSQVMEDKAPMMYNRNFAPGGKISINRKDIGNVLSTAHEMDVPVPLTAQLYEIMQNLKVCGQMDEDHSSIVRYYERLAQVEVKKHGED